MDRVESGTISVLVVDDHPLYRDSVARVIDARDGMKVVGQAGDVRDALDQLRSLRPDVCVLDYHLPGGDSTALVDAVSRENLGTRVLILSGRSDSELVYSTIEAGASGFLLKTSGGHEISDAIAEVAHGGTVLPAEFHGGLAAEIRSRQSDARPALSERELEILNLMAEGRSSAEIGEALSLAQSTVKTHITHIYDKLGVPERAAAVARAMRLGLIS